MRCAIITGAAGGIGEALVRRFAGAGYAVIATDVAPRPASLPCECFVQADLERTVDDEGYGARIFAQIREALKARQLAVLVNNAAIQVVGRVEHLGRAEWRKTLNVNLLAPFFWAQAFLPELEEAKGMVLNISSIHARLTKPNFVAYATSKSALTGMTRAMAVELGGRVRVNAIAPAAIDTPMLRAGFEGKVEALARLGSYHPSGSIGTPDALAGLALLVLENGTAFQHGAVLEFDGGIGSRLHDP
jgi:NAD(P)-dependent dehydrogenase (short-subunit alcohol dehydrogenase family)